jgi:hypothetical protein
MTQELIDGELILSGRGSVNGEEIWVSRVTNVTEYRAHYNTLAESFGPSQAIESNDGVMMLPIAYVMI